MANSLDPTNDLAHSCVRFHQPMRLRHILPRKNLFREYLHPAFAEPGQGLLDDAVPQPALIGHVAGPQAAPLEADAFADELRERGSGGQGGAAKGSQVGDAAVGSDGVEVGGEVGLTDEIDDDVDALAARGVQDPLGPVLLGAVVEPLGGAEGVGAEGDFLIAAGRDVDGGRARQPGELDPRDGHPGCARVPEHGVPALEAADQM